MSRHEIEGARTDSLGIDRAYVGRTRHDEAPRASGPSHASRTDLLTTSTRQPRVALLLGEDDPEDEVGEELGAGDEDGQDGGEADEPGIDVEPRREGGAYAPEDASLPRPDEASAPKPVADSPHAEIVFSGRRLGEEGVLVAVRGRAAAEETELGVPVRTDLVPRAGRDQDRVALPDA